MSAMLETGVEAPRDRADLLARALDEGMKIEVEKAAKAAIERAKQQACADIESNIKRIIAEVTLSVGRCWSARVFGEELIITVRMNGSLTKKEGGAT